MLRRACTELFTAPVSRKTTLVKTPRYLIRSFYPPHALSLYMEDPRFLRRTLSPLTYNAVTSLLAVRQRTFSGRNARCLSSSLYGSHKLALHTPAVRLVYSKDDCYYSSIYIVRSTHTICPTCSLAVDQSLLESETGSETYLAGIWSSYIMNVFYGTTYEK